MVRDAAGRPGRLGRAAAYNHLALDTMWITRRILFACLLAALAGPLIASDEGWVVERFDSQIEIQADTTFTAREAIDVDFRGQAKHGIYRDVASRQEYDATRTRVYPISLLAVTDAAGRQDVKSSDVNGLRRFRIGDANRTVSGRQSYRITYRVGGALNGFSEHDELYWNVTGTWPARIAAASVTVRAPAAAIERADCFQGPAGSRERCDARFTPDEATFTATRALAAGEQLTIVTWLRKGAVADPRLVLVPRSRDVTRFFDATPALLCSSAMLFVLVAGALGTLWWRVGRDRRFISLHYLSQDDRQETVPPFGSEPLVVEFEPPDKLRPAQMGLLVDERADTLDVTATIIDLAVRGYLSIKELPKTWWFGHTDWQLDRLKPPDAALLEYERIVLSGLFADTSSRRLSDLRNKFFKDLAKAKAALYEDAVARGWFPRNPNTVRTFAAVAGVFAAAAGVGLTIFLGQRWGAGLLGLPAVAGGALLTIGSRAMPRRTALGREAMRRSLGFARYLRTAETAQQAFAERARIFTAYLPYAIVFKCVDRWARAFKDIDLQQATAGWYAGSGTFDTGSFSSSLSGFSSSVSGAIASTPGGSGGSGSGGSSGGGGGGGGGGAW